MCNCTIVQQILTIIRDGRVHWILVIREASSKIIPVQMDIAGGESKHLPGWFERGGGQIAILECPWERRSLLLGAS